MTAPKPRKIGNYEVERELAEGGMGVVYVARQPSLDRPVVLKRMRRELAQNEEAEARFFREARSAAAIHHPNVVCVYDCFAWRGEPYIVCEFVDGLDLASAVAKGGGLPPRIAALIALEVTRGLEELHSRALVHRDLKPDNVLLGRGGEVKITDFGIAHDARARSLTRSGVSLGTPAYMSPEQLRGEKVDARSDLFALGVLLYESLAGRVPFDPRDPNDEETADERSLLQRIEGGHFVPLRRARRGTPRALTRFVARCLQPKAKRRPAATADAVRALEQILGPTPPAAARAEIAAWIADAKLLPGRGRTRRAETTAPEPRAGLRRWIAAAAAVAGLATAVAMSTPIELRPTWDLAWLGIGGAAEATTEAPETP
ncbi:MAG: serine/threonine-protein kinase [Myxococcota bacterium]